eukprot:2069647-Prymnesium_polylepis.1
MACALPHTAGARALPQEQLEPRAHHLRPSPQARRHAARDPLAAHQARRCRRQGARPLKTELRGLIWHAPSLIRHVSSLTWHVPPSLMWHVPC